MYLSRPCQHAIQALVHLASHREEAMCRVREIAAAQELPAPALAVVLQSLVRSGLVKSQKGPKGGFALARSAQAITLYQIMEAVDSARGVSQCSLGFEECSDDTPCPVHDHLQEIREQFIERLQSVTVTAMATAMARKKGMVLPDQGKGPQEKQG